MCAHRRTPKRGPFRDRGWYATVVINCELTINRVTYHRDYAHDGIPERARRGHLPRVWRGLVSSVAGAAAWLLLWLATTAISGIAVYGESVIHSPAWIDLSALIVATIAGVYVAIRTDPARRIWSAIPALLLTLVYARYHSDDNTRLTTALATAAAGILLAGLMSRRQRVGDW